MATRLSNLALRRFNVLSKLSSNSVVSTFPKKNCQLFLPGSNLSFAKPISTSTACFSDKNENIDEENDDNFEELEGE